MWRLYIESCKIILISVCALNGRFKNRLTHTHTHARDTGHKRLIVRWTGSMASMTFFLSNVSKAWGTRQFKFVDVLYFNFFPHSSLRFSFLKCVAWDIVFIGLFRFGYIGRVNSDAKNVGLSLQLKMVSYWETRTSQTHTHMEFLVTQIACYFRWKTNFHSSTFEDSCKEIIEPCCVERMKTKQICCHEPRWWWWR